MHHDLVAELPPNLLQGQSFGLGEQPPHQRGADRGQGDEYKVILPTNVCKRRRRRGEVSDGREKENGDGERHTPRTDVRWEDLAAVHERVGIEARSVAKTCQSSIEISNGEGVYEQANVGKEKENTGSQSCLIVGAYV